MCLREPMHVMCRGDLVRKLKVKRIPEVDAELDAIMAMPAEALAESLPAMAWHRCDKGTVPLS